MKPLIFLFARSFVNGVKRAVSSPRRLLGLIFFFGYYWFFFARNSFSGGGRNSGRLPTTIPKIDAPPIDAIDAFVFAGFVVVSMFLSLSIFSYRGGFKKADVDVLFPTPISPKVLLVFRLVRDYLLTLVFPLIMAIFIYRPVSSSWTTLFRNLPHPESSSEVTRAVMVAYLLISMAFVSLGYAASIYFNRPEEKFERAKRWVGWSMFGIFALVAAYVVIQLRGVSDLPGLIHIAQSPVLRMFFFMATGATELTMAPLAGSWMGAIVGSGILIGLIATGIGLSLKQANFIYEESALRAADVNQARDLQRRGDTFGLIAEQARSGKVKAGKQSWIHRLRVKGPSALLWREYILQARTTRVLFIIFPMFGIFLALLPVLVTQGGGSVSEKASGAMMLVTQLMMMFVSTATISQGGYMEMLRRVDLQKPLPFSPGVTMFYEICSKATLGIFTCLTSVIATLIFAPAAWPQAIAALIGMPPLALLLAAVFCLVILLFPDVEDPTQRGFRGLVNMLGIVLFCAPSAVVYLALIYFKVHPGLAAIPVAAVNIALAILCATIAGRLYASFNPSE